MIKFQLDAYLRSPGLSVKNKLCFGVNVRPEENTNGKALSDLKLIITDELCMVSNTLLLHIHQKLK